MAQSKQFQSKKNEHKKIKNEKNGYGSGLNELPRISQFNAKIMDILTVHNKKIRQTSLLWKQSKQINTQNVNFRDFPKTSLQNNQINKHLNRSSSPAAVIILHREREILIINETI